MSAFFIDPFVEIYSYPSFFLEVLIGGLLAGVMYSLVALGFVLIFKASGVFNFAQGGDGSVRRPDPGGAAADGGAGVAGDHRQRRRHGRPVLRHREDRSQTAGQPGADHPVHGDDRDQLFPGWVRPDPLGQRDQDPGHRHPEIAADHRRRADQPVRPVRGADRRRAGGGSGSVLPEDPGRPGPARRRRRPPGGDERRHPAQHHLGDRSGRWPASSPWSPASCGAASLGFSSPSRWWR